MKRSLPYILVVLLGIFFGSGVAMYRITHWDSKDATLTNGSWNGQKLENVGKDFLLTARTAVAALFALHPDETIYLVAKNDADGNQLSGKHEYEVTGFPLAARYWSITLYGEDYFLVPNEINRFNFNKFSVTANKDSSFSFRISSDRKDEYWLPSPKDKDFYLTLRLYHPEKALTEHLESIQLPVIKRVKK